MRPMPVLKNPRHERFAQLLASGRTAVDGYEEAEYGVGPRWRLTSPCAKSNTNAIRQRTASTAQRRPQEGHAEQEDA